MATPYSSHVKCAGCGHVRERGICREYDGRLFGPECWEVARRGECPWMCFSCLGWFPDEHMADALTCKNCA